MNKQGKLYIVATPIGNLADFTFRAVETLKNADIVVCEDTRVSSKLLSKYGIKKDLLPLNEFNEELVTFKILKEMETKTVAIISDAGTPLISDPGYKLVNLARKSGFSVIPIPGASAVVTALSAAGLPTDKFSFLGFLPKSQVKCRKTLEEYKNLRTTIVLYESPHRLSKMLETIHVVFGDIPVVVARELTKLHEEFIDGKVSDLEKKYLNNSIKGELVILFSTKN